MSVELTLSELMAQVKEQFSYETLCSLSDEQTTKYRNLLEHFMKVNCSMSSTKEKGDALEELVGYLLQISGNIFKVVRNVRTSTNEIDQIIQLTETGKALLKYGLLPERFELFLGECKNYNKAVGVTYIGKFYSLLQTTQITTGILFSYHGVTGAAWQNGSGLIKKIYLQREQEPFRVAIIEFSVTDFQNILQGKNFIQIIEDKLNSLRFDTSVAKFISSHPAESQLGSLEPR